MICCASDHRPDVICEPAFFSGSAVLTATTLAGRESEAYRLCDVAVPNSGPIYDSQP